jgi:hypothetical protein
MNAKGCSLYFIGAGALVIFITSGCSIERYTMSPKIEATTVQRLVSQESVSYQFVYYTYLNEQARKRHEAHLRSLIASAIQKAGYRVGDTERGKSLHVSMARLPYRTSPQDWITGLTFGAIPTSTTRKGIVQIELSLYNDSKLTAHKVYCVDSHTFNWILMVPVIWLNGFTYNQPDRYLEKTIVSLLAQER